MSMHKRLNNTWVVLAFWFGSTAAGWAGTIRFDILPLSNVGTARAIPGGVRLTDTTDPYANDPQSLSPAGAVWSLNPVSVASGFSTTFWFRMSDGTGIADPWDGVPGADGFAFLIQNGGWETATGNKALGVGAGGLGYMYISNSLAVEFDTWQNVPYGDKDGNHIAVNTRGTSYNVPHHTCQDMVQELGVSPTDCTEDPALYYQSVARPLNDGLVQQARIDYVPGNLTVPGDLTVYLNSQLLFSTPLELDTLLNLSNGAAYVGFTSGTRWGYQNTDILFAPVPEPATWLMVLIGLALVLALSRRHAG